VKPFDPERDFAAIDLHLFPKPPYDFAPTLAASRFLFVMSEARNGAFRRIIHVGDALALVEVSSVGTVDVPQLKVQVLAASGTVNSTALTAKLHRVLNLDANLAPFYAVAESEPVLAQTVRQLYGLHTMQADSLFEALLLTMIEQQIALKMAQAAERWLLEWGGESLTYEGTTYYAFPSPERIASATVTDLTPLKITFARMQRMIDLARAMVSGAFDLEALYDQPTDLAYQALIALKGVGHWTAAWTLVRALGRHPFVGSADVALRAAVNSYYYGLSGRAEIKLVEATFAQYGEFAGIAAFYTIMRWAFDRY
jgi:DNA-3-methyladenine glycosylase II